MNEKLTNYTVGQLLKIIRKETNLTQEKFSEKINKTRKWLAYKEINAKRIYIEDFIIILKTFNFDIKFICPNDERNINLTEFEPADFLRIMREFTGKYQGEFASTIGKTNFWQNLNENGKTRFYANELFELANIHNFKIEIITKKTNKKTL